MAWYHANMRRIVPALVMISLTAAACSKDKSPSPQGKSAEPTTASKEPDKTAPPAGDPCAKAEKENGNAMPWIADDYASALACAKAKQVPLVLDEWAPWCHTCLSMQSTVFTDASFAKDASKFVFASIDTERDTNAPIVTKYPLSAWPWLRSRRRRWTRTGRRSKTCTPGTS